MALKSSLRAMFGNALLVRQEEGAEIDLQVGRTVTKAPKYMRTQLWLGVLQRHPGLGNKAARMYPSLLKTAVHPTTEDAISKDVGRTFPNIPRYQTEAGKERLKRVLMAYAAYDPEVNYCQGMNFVAAVLLIWLPKEAEAFGALVVLMQERGLRELYKSNMKALQARLWQISKILPADLAEHLEQHAVLPVLYGSSWLLTAFSADFPLFWSSRVLDVILTDCYIEPMMKVVLGIVTTCKPILMGSNDMEAMVQFLKVNVPRWRHSVLQEVLTDSLAMEWTDAQQTFLRQMEAEESVIQAVHRVNSKAQEGSSPLKDTKPAGATLQRSNLSWAKRVATPIILEAQKSGASVSEDLQKTLQASHCALDQTSLAVQARSIGDAKDHSNEGAECQEPSLINMTHSNELDTSIGGQMPISSFSQSANELGTQDFGSKDSIGSQTGPSRIEVQFSKHSSTGSFGDFAGCSTWDNLNEAQDNANNIQDYPENAPGGSEQDRHSSDQAETILGNKDWWQSQGQHSLSIPPKPPHDRPVSRSGKIRNNFGASCTMQSSEPEPPAAKNGSRGAAVTNLERAHESHIEAPHTGGPRSTPMNSQWSLLDLPLDMSPLQPETEVAGTRSIDCSPSLEVKARNPPEAVELASPMAKKSVMSRQESVNSRLEAELSSLSASLSRSDVSKLPMNLRRQQSRK